MATRAADLNRRPIKLRGAPWTQSLAQALARVGLTPNQISVFSVVFASLGGGLMILSIGSVSPARALLCVAAAACIQLRLLCNMLDGLMAVEGNQQSRLGQLYNELPDRLSDLILLATAGYAANLGTHGIELGWLSAVLAMATAYVRALATAISGKSDFCGPMAKQQRMFILTATLILCAILPTPGQSAIAWSTALALICVGALITCIRRVGHLVQTLNRAEQLEAATESCIS